MAVKGKATFLNAKDVSLIYPKAGGGPRTSTFGWQSILTGSGQNKVPISPERYVLNGINIELKEGDRLGLAGRNGAGKTTLLKVLSGGLPPTNGSVQHSGRLVSLVYPQMGINSEATGYENILLRGLHLNLSLSHMRNISDEIIDFSELGEQIHEPVRTYSAGMRARLSFSIMIHSNPDIILLDEWIGAGDKMFQKKAAAKMKEFVTGARITVLATHNEQLLKSICNKVATMEQGKIVDMK